MKKFILKILPKVMVKVIYYYYYNRIKKNFFNKNYKKKALLSYIKYPFSKDSLSHTNFFEARAWADTLNDMGYVVDIIDYRNNKPPNLSSYDLICGFGDVFQKVFESKELLKAKTIYYGTGMHVCFQNHASLKRVKAVFKKKGVWLGKSARIAEKTWSHQTTLVDGMIILGNEITLKSYSKYYNGKIYIQPAPFYNIQNAIKIIENRKNESLKHFLWFGSSGLIHKGLDLCLEYFSKNKNIYLHVCGPKEVEFMNAYEDELFHCQNIKYHGFVDINSDEFKNILETCSFTIFPSCSEGGAPALLTVIGNGGLIPLITRETGVNTEHQIWIDKFNYDSLESAIEKANSYTLEEVKEIQKKNHSHVISNNSLKVYKQKLYFNLNQIINNTK